jgi:hypothetical protein
MKLLVILDNNDHHSTYIRFLLGNEATYLNNLMVTAAPTFDLVLHPASLGKKLNENFITYGTGKDKELDLSDMYRKSFQKQLRDLYQIYITS